MNSRIFFGKNTPLSFFEDHSFTEDCPYSIRYKDCRAIDIAPLHYSNTLEIMIGSNLDAVVNIESEVYELQGDCVICIPPMRIHSVTINPCDCHIYLIHISLEKLKSFVDIDSILKSEHKNSDCFIGICPKYDDVLSCVMKLIADDNSPFSRIVDLLNLLSVLANNSGSEKAHHNLRNLSGDDSLKLLINWTTENYQNDIGVKEASKIVAFSENYFCYWFKRLTGVSYNNYLTDIRLSNACRLLHETHSVSKACFGSGFKDLSYFIQLFKKKKGCTPGKYIEYDY